LEQAVDPVHALAFVKQVQHSRVEWRLAFLAMGRALGLEELGVVADGIREALEAEHDGLKGMIAEQLEYLENEAEQQSCANGRRLRGEPSTAKLQQFMSRLQDLASSPNLKTLAVMERCDSPKANTDEGNVFFRRDEPAQSLPAMGGASVRRLRALIAERRREAPTQGPSALSAVPEAPEAVAGLPSPNAPASPKGPASFDPFFGDPFA
jgi:hypothetical protein